MQAIGQSHRLSKSNKEKNFGVSVLNRESSSTGGQSEQKNNKKRSHSSSLAKSMEQPKKSKLSYAPAKSMEQPKKSKLSYAPDCDFKANRGSNSKTDRENSIPQVETDDGQYRFFSTIDVSTYHHSS
ncbi:hypothetical protein Tco_1424033 [Tanacetum coccineum]